MLRSRADNAHQPARVGIHYHDDQATPHRTASPPHKSARSHSDGEAVNGSEHGLVIARYGKQALIESRTGERLLCHLRPHLESPVAGDEVLWEPTENKGVVTALITRRNVLERPDLQGRLRPVAANIDLMLVVFAPEPAPQPALLDRYLVAAEHIDVEPVLILNKADLLVAAVSEINCNTTLRWVIERWRPTATKPTRVTCIR